MRPFTAEHVVMCNTFTVEFIDSQDYKDKKDVISYHIDLNQNQIWCDVKRICINLGNKNIKIVVTDRW